MIVVATHNARCFGATGATDPSATTRWAVSPPSVFAAPPRLSFATHRTVGFDAFAAIADVAVAYRVSTQPALVASRGQAVPRPACAAVRNTVVRRSTAGRNTCNRPKWEPG